MGRVYPSRRCGDFEVTNYRSNVLVGVRFINTGHTKTTTKSSVLSGAVSDPLAPTVHGVGCLGEGEHTAKVVGVRKKTPQYTCWSNMLARCYYPKTSRYEAYGGRGVYVAKEWLNFQNFATWYDANYREGYHLDKDLLGDGSHYGPESCCFVPQEINGLFVNNGKKSSGLLLGVSYNKRGYVSGVSIGGKVSNRKRFKTEKEAHQYYCTEKDRAVAGAALRCFSEGRISAEVRDALLNYKTEDQSEGVTHD